MSRVEPLCFFCKYLQATSDYDEERDETTYYCTAYPKGIPEAVFESGHFYPKLGDNGIHFELAEGVELPDYYHHSQEEEDDLFKDYSGDEVIYF